MARFDRRAVGRRWVAAAVAAVAMACLGHGLIGAEPDPADPIEPGASAPPSVGAYPTTFPPPVPAPPAYSASTPTPSASPCPVLPSSPYSPAGPSYFVPGCAPPVTLNRPALDLDDVYRLIEAQVADEVIARFIGRRKLTEELTADDLIQLTEKGASPAVFQALQSLPVAAERADNPISPAAFAEPVAR